MSKKDKKELIKDLVKTAYEQKLPIVITMNDPFIPLQRIKIFDGTPAELIPPHPNHPRNELEWTEDEVNELMLQYINLGIPMYEPEEGSK